MPDPDTDAEAKLKKLGERLRAGFAKQHPAQHLDVVRGAVRGQYEQEQQAKRAKEVDRPPPTKEREPEKPGPEK
jgi:hypothetical protein